MPLDSDWNTAVVRVTFQQIEGERVVQGIVPISSGNSPLPPPAAWPDGPHRPVDGGQGPQLQARSNFSLQPEPTRRRPLLELG